MRMAGSSSNFDLLHASQLVEHITVKLKLPLAIFYAAILTIFQLLTLLNIVVVCLFAFVYLFVLLYYCKIKVRYLR